MSGFTCFDRLSLRTIYVLLDAVRKGRMGKTGIAFCVVGQFLMATGAFAADQPVEDQSAYLFAATKRHGRLRMPFPMSASKEVSTLILDWLICCWSSLTR